MVSISSNFTINPNLFKIQIVRLDMTLDTHTFCHQLSFQNPLEKCDRRSRVSSPSALDAAQRAESAEAPAEGS